MEWGYHESRRAVDDWHFQFSRKQSFVPPRGMWKKHENTLGWIIALKESNWLACVKPFEKFVPPPCEGKTFDIAPAFGGTSFPNIQTKSIKKMARH